MTIPPPKVCDRARQSKDARFDGLFFTGVRSTRIFCRPVCPAPTPKQKNIVYFASAAAAVAAGFRPCLRCRPELSPDSRPNDETVQRAIALIADGWLEDGSVESLASRVGASARNLRRLFLEKAGATPLQVHQARRMLTAKQLLTETELSITDVALAAGFSSVRTFNNDFKARCGMVPSAVRRRPQTLHDDGVHLRLAYRPPFDFTQTLAILHKHTLAGIECVSALAYERHISTDNQPAWIRVDADLVKPELHLHAFGVRPEFIPPLVRRVRRMFDLDADLQAAYACLAQDPWLEVSITEHQGLRIPGAWDGFEVATAVALRRGAESREATHLMHQLLDRYGASIVGAPPGLDRLFPGADELAVADLESSIGAPALSAEAVRRLAVAVRDGDLHFGSGQRLEEFVDQMMAWTAMPRPLAQYVAWRALGDPDAWPIEGSPLGDQPGADLARCSLAWRPWRGYAALHLAFASELQLHDKAPCE